MVGKDSSVPGAHCARIAAGRRLDKRRLIYFDTLVRGTAAYATNEPIWNLAPQISGPI